MISLIQSPHAGNALRLFIEPPANAVVWRILRKGADTFTGESDPDAYVAYEGDEKVITDAHYLQNEVMAFYRPYYTADGVTWTAGATAHGTPTADYVDHTTDVLSFLRERLEAGLYVECQRGTFVTETGAISVYTAPPSLERDLRLPLVTVHLENEDPGERAIGETIAGDEFDAIGFEWDESEGWLANVQITVIGWSLNSDERIELRKALRRIIIANLPIFSSQGIEQVSFTQSDIDAVNGEYPAQIYQVMCNFTCISPVRVGGNVDAIRTIIARINNG